MGRKRRGSPSVSSSRNSKSTVEILVAKYGLLNSLLASVFGVVGIGLSAYFGYLGIQTQVKVPLSATQTAEVKLATLTYSLVATLTPTFVQNVPTFVLPTATVNPLLIQVSSTAARCLIVPINSDTKVEHDAVGNIIAITDANGVRSTYYYDAVGNRVQVMNPLNHVTRCEYDPLDRLIAVVDAVGYRTTFRYDSLSRLIEVVDPLGNTTYYTYDPNGTPVPSTQ